MLDNPSNPLERRIDRALETAPAVRIPADFAARVAIEARTRFGPMPQTLTASHFGPFAMRIALAVLIVAMLLLARYSGPPSVLSLALQVTLGAEFVGLAVYLGLRPVAGR